VNIFCSVCWLTCAKSWTPQSAKRGEAAAKELAGAVHGAFCNHCRNIPCTNQSFAGGMCVNAKLPGLTDRMQICSSRWDQRQRCAPGCVRAPLRRAARRVGVV